MVEHVEYKFKVEIFFLEECGEYRILNVIAPDGRYLPVDQGKFFKSKNDDHVKGIIDSSEISTHMKEYYGITDNDKIVYFFGDETDYEGADYFVVGVYNIENSNNFKMRFISAPRTRTCPRRYVDVDTDKIFAYQNKNDETKEFPQELFEYVNNVFSYNIEKKNILFDIQYYYIGA